MNIVSFIVENSLAFLSYHKKTSVLIILSLTASLLPFYIALANIQYFVSSFDMIRIHDAENVSILYTSDAEEAISVYKKQQHSASLKQYAKTDFIHDNVWLKVTVTYVDKEIRNYENFTILQSISETDRLFFYPACAIEENLLKFFDLHPGDVISVNDKDYQIVMIVRSIYNLQSILLSRTEINNADTIYENLIYVSAIDVSAESPTLTVRAAEEVCNHETTNGIMKSALILLVGSGLLLFAVTNISMIFIGEFERTRVSIGIRKLLGAEMNHIRHIIRMKNLILIWISDGIVYILTPLITQFSETTIDLQYSMETILVHALTSCLVAYILSSVVTRRMMKISLIAFLKNGD